MMFDQWENIETNKNGKKMENYRDWKTKQKKNTHVLLKLNNDTAIQTVPSMSNRKSKLVSRRQIPSSDICRSVNINFNAAVVKFCNIRFASGDQINEASVVANVDTLAADKCIISDDE